MDDDWLRLAGAAIPEAVLGLAGDTVAFLNDRAAALLGTSVEDLVGHPASEVIAPADLDRLVELERQHTRGWDNPETFRVRLLHRGGHEILVDLRFARTGDHLVLSARDMSETSRGERLIGQLAQLAARADDDPISFLEVAQPWFAELGWTVAYSLIEDGRVVPRAVYGRPDDPVTQYGRSILGKPLDGPSAPIASQVVATGRAVFLDNLPSTRTDQVETVAVQLDRRMAEARVRRSVWAPIWIDNAVVAVLAVAGAGLTDHDFVAIQLLAGQLGATLRNARLKAELVRRARLAAMGEVIAVVAHEARHPVAVLSAAHPLLERQPQLTDTGREAVAMVGEEVERLRRLLADLNDFARPMELRLERVRLGELVDEVVARARRDRPSAPRPEAAIPELAVTADRELLRRVLLNLVDNALAHVPEGGAIRVAAELAGQLVRLRVYNDGAPIDATTASRIFEPFFTTRPDGTGLGLFVVQHGLATMGGHIELDAMDSGVQFSAYLPHAV